LFSQSITNVRIFPAKSSYCVGDSVKIKWDFASIPSNENVRITLRKALNDELVCRIAEDIPIFRGETGFTWVVPEQCQHPQTGITEELTSGSYKIRVRWQGHQPAVYGVSSPAFQVSRCGGATPPGVKPEIIIQELIYRPDHPSEKENLVTLYARIANTGRGRASDVKVKMTLTGPGGFVPVSTERTKSLSPHTSMDITMTRKLKYWGLYRVTVEADVNNNVEEINENNNNKKFRIFALSPMCDFQVYLSEKKDFNITLKRTFTAEVRNVGHGSCPSTKLDFYLKGKGTNHYTVPKLDPGEKYTVSRSGRWYTAGTRHASVRVDPLNSIEEISEENNYKKISFKVKLPGVSFDGSGIPPSADMITDTTLNIFPTTVHIGEKVSIVAEVKNVLENTKSRPGTKLVVLIEGRSHIITDVPELYPGEKFTWRYHYSWDNPGLKRVEVYMTYEGKKFDVVEKTVNVTE